MVLRGIQEYIARDASNIFLYPPKKKKNYYYYHYLYRALCVILLSYDRE